MSFAGRDGGGIGLSGRESWERVGSSRCFVAFIVVSGRGGRGRDEDSG